MIVIKKSKNGEYYFIAKAKNGQVLVTSETYKTKEGCKKGIYATRFALLTDRDVKDETIKNGS